MLFGGWKRKGTETDFGAVVLPNTYGVVGVNVNPMYNLNHWLNVGASLDLSYDGGANLIVDDKTSKSDTATDSDVPDMEQEEGSSEVVSVGDNISRPAWYRQVAAGVSVRGEFVMPYFTINFGIGHNFINAGTGSFNGFYELLALKVALSRRIFLHIGYSLYEFQYPNNLMLGVGYRFGSRRR